MSALMTPRRSRRTRRDAARRPAAQPSLFGTVEAVTEAAAVPETFGPAATPEAATVAPAPEPEPEPEPAPAPAASPETFTTASARRQGPTLDDLVAGAWEGLLAGAPADCLVCGTPLSPRHSAGAGIVGGRCGGCGSTLG
jgi:hypothetical protein